jgi:sodium pump decarboxylase gamma subunit
MNNLGWGLQMTVLGMGLVFTLLALLWALLTLVLKFDKGEEKEEQAAPEAAAPGAQPAAEVAPAVPAIPTVNGMDAARVAAIVVAVLQHKATQRRHASPLMRTYWPGSLLYASRWVASGRARQTRSWQRSR